MPGKTRISRVSTPARALRRPRNLPGISASRGHAGIEGSGRGDVACIDIAELKATVVNLGVLAAGTWTISAAGDAPPVTLEVS